MEHGETKGPDLSGLSPWEFSAHSATRQWMTPSLRGTTPLSGLFARATGGFYHDGRFADYRAVVDHYDTHYDLDLTESEKKDLVEYLESLERAQRSSFGGLTTIQTSDWTAPRRRPYLTAQMKRGLEQ